MHRALRPHGLCAAPEDKKDDDALPVFDWSGLSVQTLFFRTFVEFRQTFWFWPSTMTFVAVLLGFLLPLLDSALGTDWFRAVGFIRTTQVDGARAILTTLATATLGVAGVAFSVTIVAVSFASANYGPRLIGNFMSDTKNQIVLGIFVATFVYCITVLSTVHARAELAETTLEAFVPQISVLFALLLTLACVGALIAYIHHIPESINIMNLTAKIGGKLHGAIARMLDEDARRNDAEREGVGVEAWHDGALAEHCNFVRARTAGFLQQIDLEALAELARDNHAQIILHRAPGDFLVSGDAVMSIRPVRNGSIIEDMRDCYTQGAKRTDVQDVLFLSDQLVEVLGRALSTGVNDPHTAMICLNWLHAGLVAFLQKPPAQPATTTDRVLYRRVLFEDMLDRSFDRMRQYLAGDRTATLHAFGILKDLASATSHQPIRDACLRQLRSLAGSARELLQETVARNEIEAEMDRILDAVAARGLAQHG